MNIVRTMPGSPIMYGQQQGLGLKLFGKTISLSGWAKKGLNAIAGIVATAIEIAVPIVGKALAEEFQGIAKTFIEGLDLSFLGSRTTLKTNLSTTEEAILDKWLLKFNPYLEKLIAELGQASQLPVENQLAAINAVLNKINVIQDHYNVTAENGLSANAIEQRNYVIYEALKLVHETAKLLLKKLQEKGVTIVQKEVSFSASLYNFQPLFSSTIVTTVTGENFVATANVPSKNSVFIGDSVQYTGPLQPNIKPVTTTLPNSKGDIVLTVEPIDTNKPTVPATNTTVPEYSNTPATGPATLPATKKDNTTKIVAGVAIGAAVLYGLSKMGKKPKAGTSKKATTRKKTSRRKK